MNGQKFFKYAFSKRSGVLGEFLRRTSLDDLPQLLNVLRGDMAMIGPDIVPHPAENLPRSEEANVKPGITSRWFFRK